MRSVLVCVRSVRAAREVASAAARLGLADAVRTATSEPEAMLRLAERTPDIVLVDTSLAQFDRVGFPRRVLARAPRAALLLFATDPTTDGRGAAAAVAAGARGLIRSSDPDAACLVAHALLLLDGPAAVVPVQREFLSDEPEDTDRGERTSADKPEIREAASGIAQLTEREAQVLRAMADGKSNAEIGRELYLSEDTVKTHARRIFRKLGARDRAHAVAAGFRAGLVV